MLETSIKLSSLNPKLNLLFDEIHNLILSSNQTLEDSSILCPQIWYIAALKPNLLQTAFIDFMLQFFSAQSTMLAQSSPILSWQHQCLILLLFFWEKEHSKRRLSLFSTAFLHMTHSVSFPMPLVANLSLVDNLSLIASQEIKAHLGIALENQISFHQVTSGMCFLIWSQILATEKTPELEGIRHA